MSLGERVRPQVRGVAMLLLLLAQGPLLPAQSRGEAGKKGVSGIQHSESEAKSGRVPQLVDITELTKIHFEHLASPDLRYIVESMGGETRSSRV